MTPEIFFRIGSSAPAVEFLSNKISCNYISHVVFICDFSLGNLSSEPFDFSSLKTRCQVTTGVIKFWTSDFGVELF